MTPDNWVISISGASGLDRKTHTFRMRCYVLTEDASVETLPKGSTGSLNSLLSGSECSVLLGVRSTAPSRISWAGCKIRFVALSRILSCCCGRRAQRHGVRSAICGFSGAIRIELVNLPSWVIYMPLTLNATDTNATFAVGACKKCACDRAESDAEGIIRRVAPIR